MGHVVILGVFVADTAYRAERMPVIGETVLGNSFSLGPGGKGSNQAVAAGRLGVKVSMISRLGKDDFGQMALETWKSSGVTPFIEEDNDSYTGAAYIFIEERTGDNAIIKVTFNSGKREGIQNKTVSLITNAVPSIKVLKVTGIVLVSKNDEL